MMHRVELNVLRNAGRIVFVFHNEVFSMIVRPFGPTNKSFQQAASFVSIVSPSSMVSLSRYPSPHLVERNSPRCVALATVKAVVNRFIKIEQ